MGTDRSIDRGAHKHTRRMPPRGRRLFPAPEPTGTDPEAMSPPRQSPVSTSEQQQQQCRPPQATRRTARQAWCHRAWSARERCCEPTGRSGSTPPTTCTLDASPDELLKRSCAGATVELRRQCDVEGTCCISARRRQLVADRFVHGRGPWPCTNRVAGSRRGRTAACEVPPSPSILPSAPSN